MDSTRGHVYAKNGLIDGEFDPDDSEGNERDALPPNNGVDELFERVRTQWNSGDWESLSMMDLYHLVDHPDRANLMLFAAAGSLQCNDYEGARKQIGLALKWGSSEERIRRMVLSGLYNSLGRTYAINGQKANAIKHFNKSISIGFPHGDVEAVQKARINEQLAQLELCFPFDFEDDASKKRTFLRKRDSFLSTGNKYNALSFIHQTLLPQMYLEIGVDQGKSLALAKCEAIGVDPVLKERIRLGNECSVVTSTSDEFFMDFYEKFITNTPDLVLLDGMPLIEYTLRDFNNMERCATPTTLVMVSGIYPNDSDQAQRRRQGMDWVGDVWKLPEILTEYRPDLFTLGVDTADNGLFIVAGLDTENRELEDNMARILEKYIHIDTPPVSVMRKKGAVAYNHPKVISLLEILKQARDQHIEKSALLLERLNTIRDKHGI